MKRAVHFLVLLSSVQLLCFGIAFADDKVVEKPVAADTPEKFADTATLIHREMGVGGRYEFIRADDKARAEADLDTMTAMIGKAGSVAAMSKEDQVRLFNTQEHLNGILTHSDRNRLVCERQRPIGSNIPQNSCKTVAEIEKMRRDSQKYMKDHAQDANVNHAAWLAGHANGH
ncbi:hypothetical protein [Rudaea sp.]|uniref:hypothetical protein n=1 Tax=Rudaea sp. TaxID=2136325 RepID=UPI002ED25936